ncbi:MAG: hypothetical protein IT431_03685 [Phycisphaerales bacterium]|nr:hypothetical protein [Phycisphaerales bacterium]
MGFRTKNMSVVRFAGAVAVLIGAVASVSAQDYGFDWVTVGDPGNRDTLPEETPRWPDLSAGGVDYEYRIMRTELTVQDHFEFVQACWQYLPPDQRRISSFLGFWIRYRGGPDDPQYYIVEGAENRPTEMSWRNSARFANWLHNGKVNEQWAFENGAYDTSTFGANGDGTLTDQPEHNPDARFWIPTMDEYVKGMFWDPAKNDGDGGYWLFPHSKDVAPIPGAPWDGGETNAGNVNLPYMDVGQYPWAASPWGMLDGSGGVREWIELLTPDARSRAMHGSIQYDPNHDIWDRVDEWLAEDPTSARGLRLAAVVPSPGTAVVFAIVLGGPSRRRRLG